MFAGSLPVKRPGEGAERLVYRPGADTGANLLSSHRLPKWAARHSDLTEAESEIVFRFQHRIFGVEIGIFTWQISWHAFNHFPDLFHHLSWVVGRGTGGSANPYSGFHLLPGLKPVWCILW